MQRHAARARVSPEATGERPVLRSDDVPAEALVQADRDGVAGRDGQAHVIEDLPAGLVADVDVLDRHLSALHLQRRRVGSIAHGGTSKASRATQTVDNLMKEARAKNIPGRSKMRKQELVEALRKAG